MERNKRRASLYNVKQVQLPNDLNSYVTEAITGREERQARREARRERRQERREDRQERRQERREERKAGGGAVKKIALAPVRGAFLGLVALNVRGLATKINALVSKGDKDIKDFWLKLGGKYDKLVDAVNKGKGKKALFGKGKGVTGANEIVYTDAIGAVDFAAVAAVIATATPALLAISKLFKKKGIPEGEGDVITTDEASKTTPIAADGQPFAASDDENTSETSFKPSPLLIGGAIAAAAALYFLTSKKKR
jgi:hypothetical protein